MGSSVLHGFVGGLRSKKVWSFPARNTVHVVAFKKNKLDFLGIDGLYLSTMPMLLPELNGENSGTFGAAG